MPPKERLNSHCTSEAAIALMRLNASDSLGCEYGFDRTVEGSFGEL
jgi:hypothetical protein